MPGAVRTTIVPAVEQARYAPRIDPVTTPSSDAATVRRAVLRSRSVPLRLRAVVRPAHSVPSWGRGQSAETIANPPGRRVIVVRSPTGLVAI